DQISGQVDGRVTRGFKREWGELEPADLERGGPRPVRDTNIRVSCEEANRPEVFLIDNNLAIENPCRHRLDTQPGPIHPCSRSRRSKRDRTPCENHIRVVILIRAIRSHVTKL